MTGLLVATPALAQQLALTSDNAKAYRGEEGKRIAVACVPNARPGTIWGSDVYADESSICAAAVHAGVITQAEGGAFVLVIAKGDTAYTGSARNGVTSRDYGAWPGSFTVEKGDGGLIDWTTKAAGLEIVKRPLAVVCPAGGSVAGPVWGTDTYTETSSICVAAVHAGLITPASGGRVTIAAAAGLPRHRGASRNGVKSAEWGRWPRSFRFEGLVAESETAMSRTATPPLTSPTPPLVVSAGQSRVGAVSNPTPLTPPKAGGTGSVAPTGRSTLGTLTSDRSRTPGQNDPPAVHATAFKAFAGYGTNVLSWKPATGATGYRLARASWDPINRRFIASAAVNIPDMPATEPGGLIVDTTFTDRQVSTGTQYVYWLDTWFRGGGGNLYSSVGAGPYPTVTVNPRDASSKPWLPGDWATAPVLTKAEHSKPPDGDNRVPFSLEWKPKTGAAGYLVRAIRQSAYDMARKTYLTHEDYNYWVSRAHCTRQEEVLTTSNTLPGHGLISTDTKLSGLMPGHIGSSALGSGYGVMANQYSQGPTSYCIAVYAIYADAIDPITGSPAVTPSFNLQATVDADVPGAVVSSPAFFNIKLFVSYVPGIDWFLSREWKPAEVTPTGMTK